MRSAIAFLALALFPSFVSAQYSGPRPPKVDVPYLILADNLVPTEAATASEVKKKDDITYTIAGATSSAKTPLAGPSFLIQTKDVEADKLSVYKFDVKNGHREITFHAGKRARNPEPIHVDVKALGAGLFRIEVTDSLPNGEYSLSPQGSNDVFCFAVY